MVIKSWIVTRSFIGLGRLRKTIVAWIRSTAQNKRIMQNGRPAIETPLEVIYDPCRKNTWEVTRGVIPRETTPACEQGEATVWSKHTAQLKLRSDAFNWLWHGPTPKCLGSVPHASDGPIAVHARINLQKLTGHAYEGHDVAAHLSVAVPMQCGPLPTRKHAGLSNGHLCT